MSSVLDVFMSGSFQTSRRISSRVTTWPARSSSTRSSSNSLLASADLGAVDEHPAPGQLHPHPADLHRRPGCSRRSSARTRASSSASRNGLPT